MRVFSLLKRKECTMKQLLIALIWIPLVTFSQYPSDYTAEQAEVYFGDHNLLIMHGEDMIREGWAHLPQTLFWKRIMELDSDSLVLNVAATREILEVVDYNEWKLLSADAKELKRITLREKYGLDPNETIYATSGKNHFYRFEDVLFTIPQGIEVFERLGVDPWYAQSILLIESPGQLKKSVAGAYGAFQLMPGVARMYGLTVNRYEDERKDFQRSAYAAARLMREVCIPEAKRILLDHHIAFEENEWWFRLFVMHVYHAGSGNVRAVVSKINPSEGGIQLIQEMWQNKAAGFGNNSQNYSQLTLAAQLKMYEMLKNRSESVYFCQHP